MLTKVSYKRRERKKESENLPPHLLRCVSLCMCISFLLSVLLCLCLPLLWRSSCYHSRSRGCEFEGKEARNKHQHQLIYPRVSEEGEAICVCEGEDTLDIQIPAWSAQILQGAPVRNASAKKWIYKIALPNVLGPFAHLSFFVSSFPSLRLFIFFLALSVPREQENDIK